MDHRDELVRLLHRLPPRQRTVIVLRYWEQRTEAETAALLGCSLGPVGATVNGRLTYVQVDYRHHEWYPTAAFLTVPSGCSGHLDLAEFNAVDWAAYVRRTLSCGAFRIAGHAWIGGRETIKVTGSERGPAPWHGVAWRIRVTVYVDPKTYLPVRLAWSNQARAPGGRTLSGAVRQDMRYLAPTPRNIGKAGIAIPAGFRRVPDGSFGGPVFQSFGQNIQPGS